MNFAPQDFAVGDLHKLASLVLLEALLSADNALILAIMVQHLPKDQQKKALMYGLLGAFVLRLGAILAASWLIALWWVQVVGAAYLIYLPIKHFIKHAQDNGEHKGKPGASFWMTVIYADIADLAFAVDSVLVAVAIEPHPSKIWVVYFGAVIGIVLLRYAATWCLTMLEKYPGLNHMAYVLVGWAGVKLGLLGGHTWGTWFEKENPGKVVPVHIPEMPVPVFWGVLALIVIVGAWVAMKNPAEVAEAHEGETEHEAIEMLEDAESQLPGEVKS